MLSGIVSAMCSLGIFSLHEHLSVVKPSSQPNLEFLVSALHVIAPPVPRSADRSITCSLADLRKGQKNIRFTFQIL